MKTHKRLWRITIPCIPLLCLIVVSYPTGTFPALTDGYFWLGFSLFWAYLIPALYYKLAFEWRTQPKAPEDLRENSERKRKVLASLLLLSLLYPKLIMFFWFYNSKRLWYSLNVFLAGGCLGLLLLVYYSCVFVFWPKKPSDDKRKRLGC